MPSPDVKHRSREWWDAITHCIQRLVLTGRPTKLFLSYRGYPCTIPGVGYIEVGTYTRDVTVGQLAEDFEEAERLRRRHYA